MARRSIILAPDAETDLEDAWTYISGEAGQDKADELFDDLIMRLRILEEQPQIGRLRPELGPGYRGWVIDNYVVVYRLNTRSIDVLRILHAARDIERILREGEA
jgi:toxin ParE1/3/4